VAASFSLRQNAFAGESAGLKPAATEKFSNKNPPRLFYAKGD
jgi:hypothetical protein